MSKRIKYRIMVYDRKFEFVREFYKLVDLEEWAGLPKRGGQYWKKKGEMIKYVNGQLYQVRFV